MIRVHFLGYIDIPAGECDSYCDIEHYLLGELGRSFYNADDAFEQLHLSYKEESVCIS